MAENLDLGVTLEAWADIVIKNWVAKIMALHAYDTFALARSFEHHILEHANGDPDKVIFAFMYYGRFVDMGVGEGKSSTGALSRDQKRIVKEQFKHGHDDMGFHKWKSFRSYNEIHLKERIAKPWYSSIFFSEVQKLQSILAEKYAHKAALYIVENLKFDVKTK